MIREPGDPQSGLSRGDIENACLLIAIPDNGCALSELPTRLGLSPLLVEPVAKAIDPLIDKGWIQQLDGCVSVTPEGRAWRKEQLSGIG